MSDEFEKESNGKEINNVPKSNDIFSPDDIFKVYEDDQQKQPDEEYIPLFKETQVEDIRPLSFGERFAAIFVSPSVLFENLKEKPVIMGAYAIYLLFVIPLAFLAGKIGIISQKIQNDYIFETSGLQVPELPAMLKSPSAAALTIAISAVSYLIGFFVSAFFVGFLIWIVLKIFGSKATFQHAFSFAAHSTVLTSAVGVIQLTISYFTGSITNYLSLAALSPDLSMFDQMFHILTLFSVSTFWYLAFFGIAGTKMFGLKKSKAIGAVIVVFLLLLLLTFAGSSIQQFFIQMQINQLSNMPR